MAAVVSTQGNFGSAHVDAYIRKKLLELGEHKFLFRRFVNKERIEPGTGVNWRALRYDRLDVPLAALSEGVAPSETDLTINVVTASATQYGLTVKMTDVLQLTINHDVVQKAISLKADVMAALDDRLIAEQALSGTNVFYGGAGPATTRAGMSATGGDVLTTTMIRRSVASLRATDGVAGQAPTPMGAPKGWYVGLIHEKQIFDVQKDSTWENAAFRQDLEGLKAGAVKQWGGVVWYSTSFLPVYQNPASGMASLTLGDDSAIIDSRGLNGAKVNVVDSGGTLVSQAYFAKITARNKKRGFEEIISSQLTTPSTGTGNDDSMVWTMPSDTSRVYTLYVGATSGDANLRRVAGGLNLAAGATVTVDAPADFASPSPNPPANGPRHVSSATDQANDVFTQFTLGGDSLAVVDLQDLESYVTNGPDSGNPLNQFVIIGSKFFLGATILQNLFMARLESQSAFSV